MCKVQRKIHSEKVTTDIPNRFITDFLSDFKGEYIKLYLLLQYLEQTNGNIRTADVCDTLEWVRSDVLRALKYLAKRGLVEYTLDTDGEISGILLEDLTSGAAVRWGKASFGDAADSSSVRQKAASGNRADSSYIDGMKTAPGYRADSSYIGGTKTASGNRADSSSADRRKASFTDRTDHFPANMPEPAPANRAAGSFTDGITVYSPNGADTSPVGELESPKSADGKHPELYADCEAAIGILLSPKHTDLIDMFHDECNLPSELIIYLFGYCREIGKTDSRYMETLGLGWYNEGILTAEDAKRKVRNKREAYRVIRKAFGETGCFGAAEEEFIDTWSAKWNMPPALIEEACNRTKLNHRVTKVFPYANSILSTWHGKGFTTLEEVREADTQHKAAEQNKALENQKKTDKISKGQVTKKKDAWSSFEQHDYTPEEWAKIEARMHRWDD